MIHCFRPFLFAALAAMAVYGVPSRALAGDAPGRAELLAKSCAKPGTWINTASGEAPSLEVFYDDLAKNPVVLLGERHDQAEHHRWQLQTIAALRGRGVKLVLAFEMFPRRVQPVLDRWVNGELSQKTFLADTEWRRVWGYAPELYMPLFDFARMNGIPMVALNVERKLVSRVAAKGWADVPPEEREGVSDPAPASDAYKRELAEVWATKQAMKAARAASERSKPTPGHPEAGNETAPKLDDTKLAEILAAPDFQHFVEAQLVWDRAMAQGLLEARRAHPDVVVVGVLGAGHAENRHGVPHQLRALEGGDAAVLLPVEVGEACSKVDIKVADALFTLKSPAVTVEARPKLGVILAPTDKAAEVSGVVPDSVGAAAGLRKGDVIVRAAGADIRNASDVIDVVSRQAWGTWLPLTVKRGRKEVRLVAKFHARPTEPVSPR